MKIKVVHIINSFGYGGGAEAMLYSLLTRTDRERFESMVVSLTDACHLPRSRALGIPVRAIGMRPGVPDPRGVVRLARLLHRERPAGRSRPGCTTRTSSAASRPGCRCPPR